MAWKPRQPILVCSCNQESRWAYRKGAFSAPPLAIFLNVRMVFLLCFPGLNELVPDNLLSVFDEYELEVTEFPGEPTSNEWGL